MAQLDQMQGLVATLVLLTVAVLAYRSVISRQRLKSSHPLPPGPKPRILIGNIPDLPPAGAKEWLHWFKLKEQYGPISSLSVLGQNIIIISDYKIAVDLMEKRSAFTSSRPVLEFGSKLCGWERGLAMMPYSPKVRAYRKALHAVLGTPSAIDPFRPLIERETRRFLVRVLEKPEDVLQLIRTQAGAIILKIGYGYTIEPRGHDPLVDLADKGLDQFSKACAPGAWMVDVIPALKYLPEWLPGTGFKRTARHWKATLHALADRPYAFVERQLKKGDTEPSYLSKLLNSDEGTSTPEAEETARWSAFALYTGGADTTVSSISCFVLAMALYPDAQKKAQAEIDAFVGTSRLPTFKDRASLPYVDALIKEVLRWHPVGPMGVPHLTTKAEVYNDYLIPENSLLIPNIWAMLHDPAVYRQPDVFNPSRFLGDCAELDPHNISFGFGRRICPGKLFADSTLFSTIASFLAVFDVRKCRDVSGKEIDPEVNFLPGLISHPKPFKCDIRPRSAEHERLIRSVEIEHPSPEHGDAKYLDSELA
ncbi:O-methylsterigmatocystin oxidoreductase [Cladophialophora carrionii]|uniref:O-methylsterigmatocystin oxidoreductase n=1 Tax=Cladophialophora carrionii TaxID=86049 RepID=A0A1C1CF41_9EURO|nr:O-methylsterigmatocystin oxidoreductase [Cladophialophora carrionii]